MLPGFGLTLGYSLVYLSIIVLLPLAALLLRPAELGLDGFWKAVTAPRVIASLKLSFGASAIAALINCAFGLIVAWVLARYQFPLKRVVDALVDLPFALPTAVAGIAADAVPAAGEEAVAVFRPGAVSVFHQAPGGSPRNSLAVTVTELEPRGDLVRVRAGHLAADVTVRSAAELDLAPGVPVFFAVKASEVAVYGR